jgi:hypothetical protein
MLYVDPAIPISDTGIASAHSLLTTPYSPIPVAVSLLTPALAVAGLALIAIPLLIHLLNRRRFKTVEWAAMRFVMAAMRRNRRRMRFESWLLLALRCAVLALAGLALARPVGCAPGAAWASTVTADTGLHVFVLDTSGSTRQAVDDDTTAHDLINDAATALIEQVGRGGGRVAVFTTAAPAQGVIPAPSFDTDAAAAAVNQLSASHARTDLAGGLSMAGDLLDAYANGEQATVHLLSDGAAGPLDDPRLAELAPRLAESADLIWYGLTGDPANTAVSDLSTPGGLARRGFDLDLLARVARYGDTGTVTVAWAVDGQRLEVVDMATDSSDAPRVVPAPPGVADAVGDGRDRVVSASVTQGGDLAEDDTRRTVVRQVRSLPVLLVEGATAGPVGGEVPLLEAALSPGGGRGEIDYVAVERIGDLELPGRPLDRYAAILLAGVGGIDEATAEQLATYVRGGGALIYFAGETTTAARVNDRLVGRGLVAGRFASRAVAGEAGLFTLDLDPRQLHPFLAAFRGAGETGIDRPAVRQYWRIEPDADLQPDVVVPFDTGDPAILSHRLGDGRVVTVATAAADPEWTLLPLTPAFPAMIHELLRGVVGESGAGSGWQSTEVGETIRLPATFAPAGATPVLLDDGPPRSFRRELRTGGSASWVLDAPAAPGVYAVQAGEASVPLVVNFPAAESDLRRADEPAVRGALGDAAVSFRPLTSVDASTLLEEEEGADWGWILLVAVLGLAATEAAYAGWLGRSRG